MWAEQIFDRTEYFSKQLNLYPNQIRIKSLRSRWGSCSSKKNINLNWKLIHTPLRVIDYVIVHELCHLVHMNHSKEFWNKVKSHIPDYKKDKNWLKEYGNFIELDY